MPNLLSLSHREFENLIFDLVSKLGLKNCVWRTPGSDVGRDIQGEYYFTDISGYFQKQTWYVECKRYTSSVDWPTVWEKISYAEAHNTDVLLFVTTSSLSPQATDQVNSWNDKRKSPIIRVLGGVDIENRLRLYPQLLVRYGLSEHVESKAAIAILPIIRLLLKINYSISSGLVFRSDVSKKSDLAQAITDLLSVRLTDLDEERGVVFYPYIDQEDGYDWLRDDYHHLERSKLDKYSLRVVLCFLRFSSRTEQITVGRTDNDRIS